jgi:hypothetical protein
MVPGQEKIKRQFGKKIFTAEVAEGAEKREKVFQESDSK